MRCSMVRDGYHHVAVAWLLGQLFAHMQYFSQPPTMQRISNRSVREVHVSRTAELREPHVVREEMALAERLHRWILARVDGRGSDARICSGELLQPNRVSRQSCRADWWTWRTRMSWTWKRAGSHINELESVAILAELKAPKQECPQPQDRLRPPCGQPGCSWRVHQAAHFFETLAESHPPCQQSALSLQPHARLPLRAL